MPDLPDWSKYQPGSVRFALEDLGEHAVRLGSQVSFDRRGEVLWQDHIAYGLAPYETLTSGTGASVKVSSDYTLQSGYALKLTGGSDSDRNANVYKFFNLPDVTRWGAEVAFAFLTDYDVFRLFLRYYDGVKFYQASAYLDFTNGEIQIRVPTLGNIKIDDLENTYRQGGIFHTLKLVGDFETNKYVRLIYDNTEYDLSAYDLYYSSIPLEVCQYIFFSLVSRSGQNDYCHVGRCIITGNEP